VVDDNPEAEHRRLMVDLTFLPGLVTSTTFRIRYSPSTIDSFDQEAVTRAVDGDEDTMRRLIRAMRPTVQAEVAWTLHRYAPRGRGRDARQELADMVQEVFLSLIDNDGRALKAWRPERGRSLKSFVAMVARHQVVSILRSGRRSPWTEDPTPVEDMNLAPEPSPETALHNADEARQLMAVLRDELSTRSMMIFEALYIEQKTVEEVCGEFGLSKNALYAWRSRLRRRIGGLTRRVRGAEDTSS